MPNEIERLLKEFIQKDPAEKAELRTFFATKFDTVLEKIQLTDAKIDRVDQDVRGVVARVKLLESHEDAEHGDENWRGSAHAHDARKAALVSPDQAHPDSIPPAVADLGACSPSGTWTWDAEAMSKVVVSMRGELDDLGTHVEALTHDRDLEAQKAKWAEEERRKADVLKTLAEKESDRLLRTRAKWVGLFSALAAAVGTLAEHFHVFH